MSGSVSTSLEITVERRNNAATVATGMFCHICDRFTLKAQKWRMTALIRKACKVYFECNVGGQDKYGLLISWAGCVAIHVDCHPNDMVGAEGSCN